MSASTSWLRTGAGIVLAAVLLGLGAGCHHGANSGNAGISGRVYYTRQPVNYDPVTGAPSGLGSGVAVPARGVVLRAFQMWLAYDQSGIPHHTWRLTATALTDSTGYYNFGSVFPTGYPTFVEVDSIFQQSGGHGSSIQIDANADGITSSTPEPQRPIYAYRQDVAGQPFADPGDATATPAVLQGSATMNFSFGLADPWVVTRSNWYLQESSSLQSPVGPAQAMGSRLLTILDTAYLFSYYYGDPTPSTIAGGVLDLHYFPGRVEAPRRSYMVYDPSTTPAAWDGKRMHYFGTLAGGSPTDPLVPDDGLDPGAILPMLARNNLFGQGLTTLFPAGASQLSTGSGQAATLAPDLAAVDGLGDAMAATLIGTPWVTDTTASTGLVGRNIDPGTPPAGGPTSPAVAAAVGWKLTLVANGVTLGAGTPAQWATFQPNNLVRFFTLTYPYTYAGAASDIKVRSDISSLYQQITRLQEPMSGADTLDLSRIFSDQILFFLLGPYGVPWTNASSWPHYATNWGVDPGFGAAAAPSASITLSMAGAARIPNPQILDPVPATVYPNVSQGEVAYFELSLTVDHTYTLTVTPQAALPADASIEVLVDGAITPPAAPSPQPQGPFVFSASPAGPVRFTLTGNPLDHNNPAWHFFRVRLLSPTTLQPDIPVTVSLS